MDAVSGVEWYLKAAQQGDAKAQFKLALCYDDGTGVPQDKALAAQWYTKAAEQGHVKAQVKLGDLLS